MSDLMIRELGSSIHTRTGNAVVLSARTFSLCSCPEDGDVDGDFEFFASTKTASALKQKGGRGFEVNHGFGQPWQEAMERINAWSRNVRGALRAIVLDSGPGFLDRVREQAWIGTRSVAERLRVARDSARGQVTDLQTAVAQRVSGWRDSAVDRQDMWPLMSADRWAEWMMDVRLRWMIFRSMLLEKLTESMRISRFALSTYWSYLMGLFRTAWSWVAFRVNGLRSFVSSRCMTLRVPLGACLFTDGRYGARVFGESLRSFTLSRKDDLVGLCEDFCRNDKDCHMADDIEFLCTEPQMKALVVAMLFSLFMLGEVLAASYLPVWCPSTTASQLSMQEMLASATLSPSVLASLNGAAGVV